jgi:hypothetical protein
MDDESADSIEKAIAARRAACFHFSLDRLLRRYFSVWIRADVQFNFALAWKGCLAIRRCHAGVAKLVDATDLNDLSALRETEDAELLKFGETC